MRGAVFLKSFFFCNNLADTRANGFRWFFNLSAWRRSDKFFIVEFEIYEVSAMPTLVVSEKGLRILEVALRDFVRRRTVPQPDEENLLREIKRRLEFLSKRQPKSRSPSRQPDSGS